VKQVANRKTASRRAEGREPPVNGRNGRFRYGVRYVRQSLPNGKKEWIATDMPREALLHPTDEDYPLEASAHNDDCVHLRNALLGRVPASGVVLMNCRVDWGVPGIEPHGPDISVFDHVRRRRNWKTFYVAQEKARILLVIEITSPDDRKNDLVIKVKEYHQAGVPLYAIVDAREKKGVRSLQMIGYRHAPGGYEKLPLDERGRLLLPPVGILLGADNERVCCYDARSGEKIGDYLSIVDSQKKAEQAQKRAEEAQKRSEQKVQQLEAELRRLRGKD